MYIEISEIKKHFVSTFTYDAKVWIWNDILFLLFQGNMTTAIKELTTKSYDNDKTLMDLGHKLVNHWDVMHCKRLLILNYKFLVGWSNNQRFKPRFKNWQLYQHIRRQIRKCQKKHFKSSWKSGKIFWHCYK